jgi:hypothetical protein
MVCGDEIDACPRTAAFVLNAEGEPHYLPSVIGQSYPKFSVLGASEIITDHG